MIRPATRGRTADRNGEEQVWWDGGDGRLDIYLTWTPPGSGGAATIAYPPGCDKRPSFILVSPTMDDDTFIPAVTHEFFHTFQFGADQGKQCAEYEWWSEATANWAIDFVYPQDNWEHKWAYYFLQTRDWREPIRDQLLDGRSSYLFPLYLTKTTGDPGVSRRSWENAANFPNDSLAAIDQAIGGGLSDVWHEFALHVANVGPVDGFKRWDGIDFPLRGDEATGGEPVTEIVGDMPRIGDIKKTYGLLRQRTAGHQVRDADRHSAPGDARLSLRLWGRADPIRGVPQPLLFTRSRMPRYRRWSRSRVRSGSARLDERLRQQDVLSRAA